MLKQFFSYYKPHKRLFIIDFSSAVFVALLELAFPLAGSMVYRQLTSKRRLGKNRYSQHSITSGLYSKYIPSIYRQLSWS